MKIKNNFLIGFIVGVGWFFVLYFFEVLSSGCSWNLRGSVDASNMFCGFTTVLFSGSVIWVWVDEVIHFIPSSLFGALVILPIMNGISFGAVLSFYFFLVKKL